MDQSRLTEPDVHRLLQHLSFPEHDRSSQRNEGDEGVAPADIVTDFFERDGDVNSDDAHFFQGDS